MTKKKIDPTALSGGQKLLFFQLYSQNRHKTPITKTHLSFRYISLGDIADSKLDVKVF